MRSRPNLQLPLSPQPHHGRQIPLSEHRHSPSTVTHVLGATYDPDLRNEPKGWRGPGLGLPNKLSGTFHAGGNKQFWNISGYEKVVVFTLSPEEEYERVMVTVEDPHEVVRLVNGAIEPAQS